MAAAKTEEVPVFEAFRDGERKMWSPDANCIPSASEIAMLKRDGYKVKIKGKGTDS